MWYGNFPILHGMYLNYREYGILSNYLYMVPLFFTFFVLRYVLIFYHQKNLHEQPAKVQLIIEHDLHHDISTTSKSSSNSEDSLDAPLLGDKSISANTEFNDIYAYFSDDSEDLVFRRRISILQLNKGASHNTPMLPQNLADELEMKRLIQKQYKHEIHQKVRWYRLIFQVAKTLKWWMMLMVCVLFLPLSMYSIIDCRYVSLISFVILTVWYIDQIYSEHKFVLFDITLENEGGHSIMKDSQVGNPHHFSLTAIK